VPEALGFGEKRSSDLMLSFLFMRILFKKLTPVYLPLEGTFRIIKSLTLSILSSFPIASTLRGIFSKSLNCCGRTSSKL